MHILKFSLQNLLSPGKFSSFQVLVYFYLTIHSISVSHILLYILRRNQTTPSTLLKNILN